MLDLNPQFKKALKLIESGETNLFITGKAGTGKSTLLKHFRDTSAKNIAVLAPTGVAALNVEGQTIHSFFGFKTSVTPQDAKRIKTHPTIQTLIKNLHILVIDEVSMVRADLMDCVDLALKRITGKKTLPFGGVQTVFIGDLYQLPPVVSTAEEKTIFSTHYQTPYFFSAQVFQQHPLKLVELEKIYRQKDEHFVQLLNRIRNRSVEDEDMLHLNQRCVPCPEQTLAITLTTTNATAQAVNHSRLQKLKGKETIFISQTSGQFEERSLPTDMELHLKPGAQVMMVNNDAAGRWVNGSMGQVTKIMTSPVQSENEEEENGPRIRVRLENGTTTDVSRHTWEQSKYVYNSTLKSLDSESIGSFTQYPIRLAWAVTIHKSQGKTFEKVVVDIGNGSFAHGQVYVALSRCTSFEGLWLKKPIQKKHILMDWSVVRFITKNQYERSEAQLPLEDKMKTIRTAIEKKSALEITYLKSNDIKSHRIVEPRKLEQMEFQGKTFLGFEAWCRSRKDTRVFRIDRLLNLKELASSGSSCNRIDQSSN